MLKHFLLFLLIIYYLQTVSHDTLSIHGNHEEFVYIANDVLYWIVAYTNTVTNTI